MAITLDNGLLAIDDGKSYKAYLNFNQFHFEIYSFEAKLEFM